MEDKWRVTTAPQADTPSQKIEDPSSMSVCKLFRDVWGKNIGNSQDTTCYQYDKGQLGPSRRKKVSACMHEQPSPQCLPKWCARAEGRNKCGFGSTFSHNLGRYCRRRVVVAQKTHLLLP